MLVIRGETQKNYTTTKMLVIRGETQNNQTTSKMLATRGETQKNYIVVEDHIIVNKMDEGDGEMIQQSPSFTENCFAYTNLQVSDIDGMVPWSTQVRSYLSLSYRALLG